VVFDQGRVFLRDPAEACAGGFPRHDCSVPTRLVHEYWILVDNCKPKKTQSSSAEVPLRLREISVASVFLPKPVRPWCRRSSVDFGGFRVHRGRFFIKSWTTGQTCLEKPSIPRVGATLRSMNRFSSVTTETKRINWLALRALCVSATAAIWGSDRLLQGSANQRL